MSYEHTDWVGNPPAHLQVEPPCLALVKFDMAPSLQPRKTVLSNKDKHHCYLLYLVAIISAELHYVTKHVEFWPDLEAIESLSRR